MTSTAMNIARQEIVSFYMASGNFVKGGTIVGQNKKFRAIPFLDLHVTIVFKRIAPVAQLDRATDS